MLVAAFLGAWIGDEDSRSAEQSIGNLAEKITRRFAEAQFIRSGGIQARQIHHLIVIFDDERHLAQVGLRVGTLRKVIGFLRLFALDQSNDGLITDNTVRVRKKHVGLRWFVHIENFNQEGTGGLKETRFVHLTSQSPK